MEEEFKGKLAVLASAAVWGFSGIALRKLYDHGLNVPTILFILCVSVVFIMLIFFKKIDFRPSKKELKLIFYFTVFGNISAALLFYAFKFTKIGTAEFLHYTMPAWAFIIAVFLLKEKIGKWRVLALIVSLMGIALVFDIKSFTDMRNITNLGNMLAFASAFSYAAQISVSRKIKSNSYTVNFWDFFISIFILAPWFFFNNSISSPANIFYIFIFAAIFSIAPMLLYIYGTKKIEVTKSSILMLFEAVVAVLAASVILKEFLGIQNIIGGILILISSAILIVKKK